MKNERNALKAGIFILVSLVLVIVLIIAVKGVERLVEPMQVRVADFRLEDDLGGLNIGDDVRIGGYRVGVVRNIQVVQPGESDKGPHLTVEFSMPQKYALREGAKLSIQGTLTGTSWLNFESLGNGEPLPAQTPLTGNPGRLTVLSEGVAQLMPRVNALVEEVRSKTIPKANDTIDRFGETADTIGKMSKTADGLVGDVRGNLPMILERYQKVADRAAEMMAEVRDVLGDTKGDIRGTMANLNGATGDLKEKLPGTLDKVQSVLAGISETMEDLKATIANSRSMSESAKLLISSNRPQIDSMIRSFKTTADNLRSASAELRRSPWRLLYKPQPGEMANLNVFDAAREFAEGARAMEDASQALRSTMMDPSADEEQLRALMQDLEIKADAYRELRQKLWDAVQQ